MGLNTERLNLNAEGGAMAHNHRAGHRAVPGGFLGLEAGRDFEE